jgi:hypothetical protein
MTSNNKENSIESKEAVTIVEELNSKIEFQPNSIETKRQQFKASSNKKNWLTISSESGSVKYDTADLLADIIQSDTLYDKKSLNSYISSGDDDDIKRKSYAEMNQKIKEELNNNSNSSSLRRTSSLNSLHLQMKEVKRLKETQLSSMESDMNSKDSRLKRFLEELSFSNSNDASSNYSIDYNEPLSDFKSSKSKINL